MRKLFAVLLIVLSAVPAIAAYTGPTQALPTGTVKEVLSGSDNAQMCLEGHIVSKQEGTMDKYNFEDPTGSLTAEIDEKVFGTMNVNASTKVRICGEIDKEFTRKNEFDVKTLQLMP